VHVLSEDLRTEIDRIKEKLGKLTEEVEKIRGQEREGLVVVGDATGELRHEPKG